MLGNNSTRIAALFVILLAFALLPTAHASTYWILGSGQFGKLAGYMSGGTSNSILLAEFNNPYTFVHGGNDCTDLPKAHCVSDVREGGSCSGTTGWVLYDQESWSYSTADWYDPWANDLKMDNCLDTKSGEGTLILAPGTDIITKNGTTCNSGAYPGTSGQPCEMLTAQYPLKMATGYWSNGYQPSTPPIADYYDVQAQAEETSISFFDAYVNEAAQQIHSKASSVIIMAGLTDAPARGYVTPTQLYDAAISVCSPNGAAQGFWLNIVATSTDPTYIQAFSTFIQKWYDNGISCAGGSTPPPPPPPPPSSSNVMFTESGLPSGSTWSVTYDAMTESNTAGGTLTFPIASSSTGNCAPITGPLTTSGTMLYTPSGAQACLRSAVLAGMTLGQGKSVAQGGDSCASWEGWQQATAGAITTLKKMGVNTVRLPISWSNLEPTAPVMSGGTLVHSWNMQYVNALDGEISMLTSNGFAVIIDFHQDDLSPAFANVFNNGKCEGDGVPAWLFPVSGRTGTGGAGGVDGNYQLGFYDFADNVQEAASVGEKPWAGQDAAWSFIANRYAGNPMVIGADLFNEPYVFKSKYGAPSANLGAFYVQLGDAVRASAPKWLLIFETCQQGETQVSQLSGACPPESIVPQTFQNTVYSYHIYAGASSPSTCLTAPSTCTSLDVQDLNWELSQASSYSSPLWVGEFNIYLPLSATASNSEYDNLVGPSYQVMDGNNIGWAYFSIKYNGGCEISFTSQLCANSIALANQYALAGVSATSYSVPSVIAGTTTYVASPASGSVSSSQTVPIVFAPSGTTSTGTSSVPYSSCDGFFVAESATGASYNAICTWTGGQLQLSAGGGSTGAVSWAITNTVTGLVIDTGSTTNPCLTYQTTLHANPGTYNVFITSGSGSSSCSTLTNAEVVLNAIYPVSMQLSVSATKIIPGASDYISETVFNASCNAATLMEISSPGASCVDPYNLTTMLTTSHAVSNSICNEAHGKGYASNPYPPCLLDAANVMMPDTVVGWSRSYCNMTYVTNSTLVPGLYQACGYYQATDCPTVGILLSDYGQPGPLTPCNQTAPSGYAFTNGPQEPTGNRYVAMGTINITGMDMPGSPQLENPSIGWTLSGSCSGSTCTVTPSPFTVIGSPYWWYWYILQGVATPPTSTNIYPKSPNMFLEVASGDPSGGCVSPVSPGGILILPLCDNTQQLPCLLSTSDSAGSGFITPNFGPGNYMYCLYNYTTPTKMKPNYGYPDDNSLGWNTIRYKYLGFYNAPLEYSTANTAIFFASVNAQCKGSFKVPALPCSSGILPDSSYGSQCTSGGQTVSEASCVTGAFSNCQSTPTQNCAPAGCTPGPYGTLSCTFGTSNSEVAAIFNATVNVPISSAYGIVTVVPGAQYIGSEGSSVITANVFGALNYPTNVFFIPVGGSTLIGDPQTQCSIISQSSGKACKGTAADGNPGGCLISYTPTLGGGYTSIIGGPKGPSCSEYISGYPQLGDSCEVSWKSSASLPANQYLICEMYADQYVAAGVLDILPKSSSSSSSANLGNAVIAPLSGELCNVYSSINSILFLIGLTLVIIGAILYEGASIFPAQHRGTLQGYAMGMVLGGIVGIAIAGISVYVVSIVANIPASQLAGACP